MGVCEMTNYHLDGIATQRCGNSISGRSAELFFARDPSIAKMLRSHGIGVRDFILASFLYDQGPMRVSQLARILSLESDDILRSITRLVAAGLLAENPGETEQLADTVVQLTTRGVDLATHINSEL
jgi:DNA-binding MarR family transcriptional regulator